MSHNLEQQPDGTYSFVSAREPGWHKLGKTYTDQDGLTLDTILTDINAGELVESPAMGFFPDPSLVFPAVAQQYFELPDKKMVARRRTTDAGLQEITPLGIVGKNRPTVPEREAFGFLQQIVDSGEALYQTAGLLGNGERAFCSLKFPEGLLIGGVDPIDLYLMIVVSHNATISLTGAATIIRPVCQNTVTAGLQAAKQTWKIRHTKHMNLDPKVAREQLDLTFSYVDEWSVGAQQLIETQMTNDAFDAIVRDLYAPKDDAAKMAVTMFEQRRERLLGLYTSAGTQENIRGTAWAGYNAIVEDLDWFLGVRNAEDKEDVDAYRFERSITEGATDEKTKAWNTCLAYAASK